MKEQFGNFKVERVNLNEKTLSLFLDIQQASILARKIEVAKEMKMSKIFILINQPDYFYFQKKNKKISAKIKAS